MSSPGQIFLGTPLLKRGGDGKLKGKRNNTRRIKTALAHQWGFRHSRSIRNGQPS